MLLQFNEKDLQNMADALEHILETEVMPKDVQVEMLDTFCKVKAAQGEHKVEINMAPAIDETMVM